MIISEYNPVAAEKLSITETDKPGLLKLAEQISDLCRKAREDGLLVLENSLQELTEPMLKLGVSLVLDGTDADLLKDILLTALHAGNYSGSELVKRLIIADGVILLQQGNNPTQVQTCLSAYLGENAAAAALQG